MRSEEYVRPPIVPREPSSSRIALWRFRIVALLLLIALVIAFVVLFLQFSDVTGGEDPGLGAPLSRPTGL